MVRLPRSARGRGRFRPLCGGRCTIATGLAVSRALSAASATLSNLALLCRWHHRVVHEAGYRMERQADGQLRYWRPDGRLLPDVPSPAVVPAQPAHALRARNDAQGLHIDARTAMPGWL